ncbi:beta-galactosidase trimerization domain-containing protein [Nonomuraea sediminis]|uniref:beta-galactosidase trimerization domain-containing protein n=1 Tax=Nonomuraea sediminis TaxID=2835864 RepID=UPI001BDC9A35|nr:hypothetical protein [Nonomuraea sediminis]
MNLFDVLRNPPRSHSPAAIWWWSGEPLRRDRLRWQLERLVAGGVHNLVILNLAPSGPLFGSAADDPPFFSEAWWELLDGVCADAFELGAFLWFYDQLGFSGADIQARLVAENPAFAGQWLAADGSVSLRGFDYLSRTACAALIDRVHGEFERRLGHWFGRVIVGSFQDELPSIPTWSATFAAEYESRRGRPFSPGRDHQRTRAELAEEAFFRPLHDWHARHGLLHGCDQQDPARAGHPVEGVELYADYPRTHRWFTAPGSDHHGDAHLHSSLAHLYGRPRVWIEAFHSSGWGGTLEETFDWLLPWLRAGATLYNPHAVYYSTKASWWEWAPPATDWRQPYWRHHRVFADAVTRLCAALSLGRHLCDVAVLHPTATAQSAPAEAAAAQRVYREIVGDMTWFDARPGVLDRLCLDFDVIDDDSLRRATARGGRLSVSTESYRVVILPAVTVLDEDVAARLAEFARAGGILVAVETAPVEGARFVAEARDLPAALTDHVPRVEAAVTPLVREVDGTTVVFLTAAARASEVSVGRPDERGVELGWLDAVVDFDPARYAREMTVRVRDVSGTPLLVSPFGGDARGLPYEIVDGAVEVRVPFDDGPAALLLFTGEEVPPGPAPADHREVADLGDEWDVELVETIDDTWGDFGSSGVERWSVGGVHATFAARGLVRTSDEWREAVWSSSRGMLKDPIHRETLGPKGRVPEEFLDFGRVEAGRSAWFMADVAVAEGSWLVVGGAGVKRVWVDGAEVVLDDAGYLAVSASPVGGGSYLVEFVPDEEVWLRAHVSFTKYPDSVRRPEWIEGPAMEVRTSAGLLQVASLGQCRILVDGAEVGRQGGFDPYAEAEIPRVRRYQVPAGTLRIEGEGRVLVDGAAVSGPHWKDATVRRRQHGDPAALHLLPRPHPLPEAGWLDGRDTSLPAVFTIPGAEERTEQLVVEVPPGATSMTVPAWGVVDWLPGQAPARVELQITTPPGHPTLGGPIRFACGAGRMRLGDWESQGLAGFSGGVRYRTTVTVRGPARLDLGRVRGTAEVFVDGRSQGVRVCSPYAFDLDLEAPESSLEILVLGTLGPHMDENSPTHFIGKGQRVSGLFGPVRLSF